MKAELKQRTNHHGEKSGKPSFLHLLSVAGEALLMWPPDYVKSFLGPYRQWLPPYNGFSEFTMIDVWQLRRSLKFILDINFPSISAAPPPLMPPLITDLVWQPTEIRQRPDNYDNYTSFPGEHWFFINGIMTNTPLAQLNAACLTYLFHRPITLIQNSTDGWYLDLWECSLGKEWFQNTESATKAMPAIYDALKDPEKTKVVVICHSQGTIIMAVVLRALKAIEQHWAQKARANNGGNPKISAAKKKKKGTELAEVPLGPGAEIPLGSVEEWNAADAPLYIFQNEVPLNPEDFQPLSEQEWQKLEIYCFANCASEMQYYKNIPGSRPLPWIESFGNENDLVARLGMFAPHIEDENIRLDGPFYMHPGAWGHLLNHSYLIPIAEEQMKGRKRGGAGEARPFVLANQVEYTGADTPRLFAYINGGSPGPL